MVKTRRLQRCARGSIHTLGAVAMLLGAVLVAAPAADAGGRSQSGLPPGPFAIDLDIFANEACPASFSDLGTFNFRPGLTMRFCRPAGFHPVRTAAACDEARAGSFGVPVFFPTASVCAINGAQSPPGTSCSAGTIRIDEPFPGQRRVFAGCVLPVLTNEGSATIFGAEPVCIESDAVQGDPAAASLAAGATFSAASGSTLLISAGNPGCQFNCLNGLDANCDGKPGDYCPPGSDPHVVADVKACLASLEPVSTSAPADPAAPEETATVTAESQPVGGLAHTGAETTVLAYLGLTFDGSGMCVMGLRRTAAHFLADHHGV